MILLVLLSHLYANEPRTCQQEIEDNPQICIIGGALKPELHCQMRGEPPVEDRAYLDNFIHQNRGLTCELNSPLNHNDTLFRGTFGDTLLNTQGIKRECIIASMKRIPELDAPRRLTCTNNNENPMTHTYWSTSRSEYKRTELCITNDIVDYIQASYNDAVTCVSNINDDMGNPPLDSAMLFAKINNESAFGFFLQSSAGIGVTQLTTVAMQEMGPGERGIQYLDALKESNSPACAKLKSTMSHDVSYSRQNHVRHCQLVGMGEGLVRNLFYGFALLAHNRNTHGTGDRNSTRSYVKRNYNITNPEVINMVNLITFGRNGFGGRNATLRRIKGNIKFIQNKLTSNKRELSQINRRLQTTELNERDRESLELRKRELLISIQEFSTYPNNLSSASPEQMHKLLMESSDYYRETYTKMCEFNKYKKGLSNKNCSEDEAMAMDYQELRGDQCIGS